MKRSGCLGLFNVLWTWLLPVKFYGGGDSSIPSSIDSVASNANAKLVNQQWQDYKKRFQPQESNLIDQMGDGKQTTFLPKALDNAKTDVNNAFSSASGQQSRDLSRYGQAITDNQSQAQATQLGLSKSANMANANNQTIQNDQDIKNEIMSGGLGAISTAGQRP